MSSSPPAELSSAQVADYLGVKVETVYAYVSRGVLTPVRRESPRGSIFALADVQALVSQAPARTRRRPPSTSDDVRTGITQIRDDRLSYRGRDAAELARTATFEDVCGLLWQTEDVTFCLNGSDLAAIEALTRALPADTPVLDRFKHAALVAGTNDAGRHDQSPAAVIEAGRRTAAMMAMTLPGAPGSKSARTQGSSNRLSGTLAASLPGSHVEDLDAALVLLADHDMAISTTALRVAVSARTDPYSAFLAALAAADSPVHMGASRRAHAWLTSALNDPRSALDEALSGGCPPGFGHKVYREVDPRAEVLLERVLPRAAPTVRTTVWMLCDELLERRGWPANVDFALSLMSLVDDLPSSAGQSVFACARVAGWTAHMLEELAEPPLRFRLRGLYTGQR